MFGWSVAILPFCKPFLWLICLHLVRCSLCATLRPLGPVPKPLRRPERLTNIDSLSLSLSLSLCYARVSYHVTFCAMPS
uniref:Putative secreted protein n=1 Tax=Anopheles triannulatus TaxID=58253 RepID=A0A2M4B2J8_9DIPT